MPILWFEQHVEMSEDIANEVKMILAMPHSGQMMGLLFVVIGMVQIMFLPIKNFVTSRFCLKQSKVCDVNRKAEVELSKPEFSPLIAEKPMNGISLIGNTKVL